MNSKKTVNKLFNRTDQKNINRRTFFKHSFGYTVGLTLLASPGIITDVLAAEGDQSHKDIFKELDEKVVKFLPMYRSCALASFGALNEQFKLDADNKTLRALMPFTGGISLKGETCGAVSGSLLAIGYFFESINQKEKETAGSSIKHGGVFFDRFTKEFSSTRCKEVLKHQYGRSYDFLNPEEQKLFMEASEKSGKCLEVVKKAVFIAGDIILENS
ncbi:MAG: C-GCAxxG-C-C family protein [Candidatus Aminicenantes bacterium]